MVLLSSWWERLIGNLMEHFYTFCIILTLVIMSFKIYSYWRFRRKLNAKLIELIRLEGYKEFKYLNLFTASCMLFCLYFTLKGSRLEENQILMSLFWALAFVFHLINTFIEPQNYFLINEQGFKKSYISRWTHWENIEKVNVKEKKLFINTGKKRYFLAFSDRSAINHFIVGLKRFHPELYQKYLINLSNA